MKIRSFAVVGAFVLASVAAACAPPVVPTTTTTSTVVGTAPATISGSGRYDFSVLFLGSPDSSGSNPATISLTKSGLTYSGTVLSAGTATPKKFTTLTTVGKKITHVYTRDSNMGTGVGFELSTSNVTTAKVTGGVCTGTGLKITFSGPYTIDARPSQYTGNDVWTVCDAAAAAYFG